MQILATDSTSNTQWWWPHIKGRHLKDSYLVKSLINGGDWFVLSLTSPNALFLPWSLTSLPSAVF